MSRRSCCLVLALPVALLASPAGAATRCVKKPPAGACFTSIQAAVTASGPGDIVSVGPGVFFENITIAAGRDGLQLVGANKTTTIIDADAPNSGNAISIASPGVKVKNLGIRNGQLSGIIVLGVDDVVIQGVRIVGLRADEVSIGIGGAPGSDGLQILGNEIRAVGGFGIEVLNSSGLVVTGNTIAQTPAGILVVGTAGAKVISNKVNGASAGIGVSANAAVVATNLVEQATTIGLIVAGLNPTVQKNKLTNGGLVQVNCTACTGGLMSSNTSLGSSGPGMLVAANAPGFVVQGNTVTRAAGAAFAVSGSSVQLTSNTATDTGVFASAGHCFHVAAGTQHTLTGNKATRCAESAFYVSADDVTLSGNTATQAGVNGFTIFGNAGANADASLLGNKSMSSNGAGFAVIDLAQQTLLETNSASGNRYGFCNDGTGTIIGGNNFGSPATSAVCDVPQ
jgi:hypothetical protein